MVAADAAATESVSPVIGARYSVASQSSWMREREGTGWHCGQHAFAKPNTASTSRLSIGTLLSIIRRSANTVQPVIARWSLTKWSVSFVPFLSFPLLFGLSVVKLETHPIRRGKEDTQQAVSEQALPEPLGRASADRGTYTHTHIQQRGQWQSNMKWKENKSTEMNWSIIDCFLWTRCTSILTIKAKHSCNFLHSPALVVLPAVAMFFNQLPWISAFEFSFFIFVKIFLLQIKIWYLLSLNFKNSQEL